MTVMVKLQIPFESLLEAIASLSLEEKQQLQETLEQQIFEQEEAFYEDNLETLSEIQSVRDEYAAGEYQTLIDEMFIGSKKRSQLLNYCQISASANFTKNQ